MCISFIMNINQSFYDLPCKLPCFTLWDFVFRFIF